MWPAHFGRKLVSGTRRKWPRPRRLPPDTETRPRRWPFFSRRDVGTSRDRLETETSRPRSQPCCNCVTRMLYKDSYIYVMFWLLNYDVTFTLLYVIHICWPAFWHAQLSLNEYLLIDRLLWMLTWASVRTEKTNFVFKDMQGARPRAAPCYNVSR